MNTSTTDPLSADPASVCLLPAGWDEAWQAAFATVLDDRTAAPSQRGWVARFPGRVSRADRGGCDVLVAGDADASPEHVLATWGAKLSEQIAAEPTRVPAAGDWVVLASWEDQASSGGGRLTVENVLPRRTSLVRAHAARSSYGQVLAANADVVAVVEGMTPDPDLGRLERLLALAWSSGGHPVVVLTKADLVPDAEHLVDDVTQLAPGADVLAVSATDDVGLDPLRRMLAQGSTIALVGASGVGKSTLLNALVGGDAMETRGLGAANKGRHTTVTRELHLTPAGGAVLDTPGLRGVGLLGDEPLDDVFPEVEELAAKCRFDDCSHTCEPGCAVLDAVESGALPERRLVSYRKLLREVEYQASRVDARVRAERAGRWKAIHRANRQRPNRP